jgi:hypothetical protein
VPVADSAEGLSGVAESTSTAIDMRIYHIQMGVKMKQSLSLAALFLACMLVAGCMSTTQMTGVWSEPGYVGDPGGKVLVLGIGATDIGTRLFEDAMAQQLAKRKLEVVKGSTVFPVNAPVDTALLRQYVEENGISLLSVTRLLDISKEQEYVPGTTAYVPVATYSTFGGYYSHSYAVVHEPGYIRESMTATIESNAYSTKSNGLVWSGRSKTVDPASLDDAVWDIAGALVGNMAKKGVLGPDVKD